MHQEPSLQHKSGMPKLKKRNCRNYVWSTEVSSVYLWTANKRRSQATAIYLKQAVTSSTTKTAKDDVDSATVRPQIKYLPGSELSIADALSRSYFQGPRKLYFQTLKLMKFSLLCTFPFHQRNTELTKATADETALQALATVILNEWPKHKEELPSNVHQYRGYIDEISLVDELLLKAQKANCSPEYEKGNARPHP